MTLDPGQLRAELDLGKSRVVEGVVLDFTESSARVRVRESLPGGTQVALRLVRPSTGVSCSVPAQVVWHRPQPDGDTHLGLKFAPLGPVEHHELMAACVWSVTATPTEWTLVIRGDLGELIDLAPLAAELAGAPSLVMDLAHVRHINSIGAVRWIDFVHELSRQPLRFQRCSLEFTSHAAMSGSMLGHGAVDSVMAPYLCTSCDQSEIRQVDVAPLRATGSLKPPTFRCSRCPGTLEFDDLPERYFSFLADLPR